MAMLASSRMRSAIVFGCLMVALAPIQACVDLIGHASDSLVHHDNGTEWDYSFLGTNWEGVDATGKPWVCKSGKVQSPINLPSYASLPKLASATKIQFVLNKTSPGKVPPAHVFNNGHTIQVQNFAKTFAAIKVPTLGSVTDMLSPDMATKKYTWATLPALQFHFHTASEYKYMGLRSELELHVVHKGDVGFAVVGMHVRVEDSRGNNSALEPILKVAPFREGASVPLINGTSLDFSKIYPSDKSYITFKGSLTTPPCTEGLLWIFLKTPIYISTYQYHTYMNAIGAKKCEGTGHTAKCKLAAWNQNYREVQPINSRPIFYFA